MINTNLATQSVWANTNKSVVEFLQQHGTITIHSCDRDRGYPCLAVLPWMGVPEVLCKPAGELLGKPAREATEIIGASKERAIEEAIASGETAVTHYEMLWGGVLWRKRVSAILLADTNEIMIANEGADGEAWQRDYWQRYLRA